MPKKTNGEDERMNLYGRVHQNVMSLDAVLLGSDLPFDKLTKVNQKIEEVIEFVNKED